MAQELSPELKELTSRAIVICERMHPDVKELCEIFVRVKEILPHGEWTPWVERNFSRFNIGIRQVQRYMELGRDETGTKTLESTQWRSKNPLVKNDSESHLKIDEDKKLVVQTFRREMTQLKKENEALFENRMRFAINRVKESLNADVFNALLEMRPEDLLSDEFNLVQELIDECDHLATRASYWVKTLGDHFETFSSTQHRKAFGDE